MNFDKFQPRPTYGPPYGWGWSSFINANNFAAGCNFRGTPTDCNSAMLATMGPEFAANLPGAHLDMAVGEQQNSRYVAEMFAAADQRKKQKHPPRLKDQTQIERDTRRRIKRKRGTNPFGLEADENTPVDLYTYRQPP